jgi:hypothetical protein
MLFLAQTQANVKLISGAGLIRRSEKVQSQKAGPALEANSLCPSHRGRMMREVESKPELSVKEPPMSTEEKPKSKETEAAENEVAKNMESEMEDRDETRREGDRAEQQDLNQGMDTGTHASTRSGVNWPASYRNLSTRVPDKPKEVPEKKDDKPD